MADSHVEAVRGSGAPVTTYTGLVHNLTEETQEFFGAADERFTLRELLGEGGYGSVYRCSLQCKRRKSQAEEAEELEAAAAAFSVSASNLDSGDYTSISVAGPDTDALVACVTRTLAAESCSIQEFHGLPTPGATFSDLFYITRAGQQIPLQDLEELTHRLQLAIGRHRLDTMRPTGDDVEEDYAVKIVNVARLEVILGIPLEQVCAAVRKEVEIQAHLGLHPHIVRLHRAYFSQETSRFYFVSELMRGGDLFRSMLRRKKSCSEAEARTVVAQIVGAVAFCHSRGVAHRDLKLENCLLEDVDSLTVKVCDYGQSKFLGFQSTAKTLTTTPVYTAPEVGHALKDSRAYDAYKADAFSIGVITFCLLCNALPNGVVRKAYEHHQNWKGLSNLAKDLIGRLLVADPDRRLSAAEALEHPWLRRGPGADAGIVRPDTAFALVDQPSSPKSDVAKPSPELWHETETLLSAQHVVTAIRQERQSCCWALASTEGEVGFHFHWRYTDERLLECERLVAAAVDVTTSVGRLSEMKAWSMLQTMLRQSCAHIVPVRNKACALMQSRSACATAHDAMMAIFEAYHPAVDQVVGAVVSVLSAMREGGAEGTPSRGELRHGVLSAAAEQLSRERGFIAGHLCRPDQLLTPPALLLLVEMIGARKALLGSAKSGTSGSQGSGAGLLSAFGLAEGAPLERAELAQLEQVESHVLTTSSTDAALVQKWYYLLTALVDKVQQQIFIGLADTARSENRIDSFWGAESPEPP